jgi:hypothetical protein
MDVTFTRTGERRYAVGIEFPDAPALIMHPAPGFDPKIPHDLVHLAVELEYGIAHGVFGQVADGGHAGTFRRADGAVDRNLRRRGDRLVRQYGDQLARSEALAQAATVAWHRGARPAADPGVERACARLDALSESWQRLGVGETMSVSWPPRRSR